MADEIIHPDKCCVECKNFGLSTATQDWSEVTPGTSFYMWCEKDHWKYEEYGTEEEYRNCILAAKRCLDFEQRETNG